MEDDPEEEGHLAYTYSSGYEAWYDKKGRIHRLNGPALTYSDNTRCWYSHGLLHRDDGPAAVYRNGKEEWYKDDKLYEPSAHELITWKMKKGE